jgi:hypothetical protein
LISLKIALTKGAKRVGSLQERRRNQNNNCEDNKSTAANNVWHGTEAKAEVKHAALLSSPFLARRSQLSSGDHVERDPVEGENGGGHRKIDTHDTPTHPL